MKYDSKGRAFTVLETLVVLAVSSALFVAIAVGLSGRQDSVEFAQAMQNVKAQVQQTIDDVSSGYYPSSNNISCSGNSSGPSISSGSGVAQGSNGGCIFLGQVMQFGVDKSAGVATNPEVFESYTIAGLQKVGGGTTGTDVGYNAVTLDGNPYLDYSIALPKVVDPTSPTALPTTSGTLENGLKTQAAGFKYSEPYSYTTSGGPFSGGDLANENITTPTTNCNYANPIPPSYPAPAGSNSAPWVPPPGGAFPSTAPSSACLPNQNGQWIGTWTGYFYAEQTATYSFCGNTNSAMDIWLGPPGPTASTPVFSTDGSANYTNTYSYGKICSPGTAGSFTNFNSVAPANYSNDVNSSYVAQQSLVGGTYYPLTIQYFSYNTGSSSGSWTGYANAGWYGSGTVTQSCGTGCTYTTNWSDGNTSWTQDLCQSNAPGACTSGGGTVNVVTLPQTQSIGAVAFLKCLNNATGATNNLLSGSECVNVVPISNTTLGMTAATAVGDINTWLQQPNPPPVGPTNVPVIVNPSNGVTLCFASATTNQSGLITIGNNNRQLSITLQIKNGPSC